jgi:probable blue pigment (indigoidine) exporter
MLWFRGLGRLGPGAVAPLALLSPVTAVILGLSIAGEHLSMVQAVGIALVLGSVLAAQWVQRPRPVKAPLATG